MTVPVPPAAITAAARAIHADGHPNGGCDIEPLPQHIRCAQAALDAAAPIIRAEADREHASLRGQYANDLAAERAKVAAERERIGLAIRHTCACQPCKDAIKHLLGGATTTPATEGSPA